MPCREPRADVPLKRTFKNLNFQSKVRKRQGSLGHCLAGAFAVAGKRPLRVLP